MSELSVKKSICPYDCPSSCGLVLTLKDGRITKVTNDPEHPVSCDLICEKMRHYEESIYSEKRILTPLKRNGKKGEGCFTPISWEEAIRIITDHWKSLCETYGAQSILPCVYSGVMSDIQRNCGDAFFNRMGASALVKTLCSSAKGAGYKAVMGSTGCLDPRELKYSDLYLVWGSDLTATRLQTLAMLKGKQQQDKKKMILIDTYESPTARFCDETLILRPGSDGALALSVMHVLQAENLADEEWLLANGEGYEAFAKTLSAFSPEWAETITNIPADRIRELARTYASANSPAIILGSGNSRHKNGGMNVRLITLLSQFTGAWKKPGGGLCGCTPVSGPYVDMSRINRPDFRNTPARKININQIANALSLSGKDVVKSLYVYGCNPLNSVSNQNGMIHGLLRDDLFTVVHERFMTDTALYADIILPATFSVEQNDIYRSYGYCTLGVAKKLIKAPGECKSNWDTFCLLAKGMGFSDSYFSMSEEEILADILAHPTAVTAALSEQEKNILKEGGSVSMPYADHCSIQTASRKFMFYNEDCPVPLATYVPSEKSDYPLHLIAAPDIRSVNSIFHDRTDLMKKRGSMTLLIHPDAAASRNISDGDSVIVKNDIGEAVFTAGIINGIDPDTVVGCGVWSMQDAGGFTFEALTHEDLSDIGEATTLNENRVEVIKQTHP